MQLKTVPTLSDFLGTLPWSNRAKLAATTDFRVDNSRLNVKQDDAFRKDPLNLIRFFAEAARNNLLLHPQAIRLVRSSLRGIDDSFRTNQEANQLFLTLLTSHNAPDTALRCMNELGVLGRFIPDFGRVVAMATFNMYHHFTIDEHTIRAIGILSRIEKGAFSEELPLATEVISGIQNRRSLYLALLMHDVAKAVEGDHSKVGAAMARKLALRMGLEPGEAETAAWLVEHHLLMSQIAQHRDISDPQTVRNFADIVQSPERLKLLLLLTVADIRAVGPGIWNGWKGQLLRSLYYDTEPLLAGGHTRQPRHARIVSAQVRLREALSRWPGPEVERFIDRHEPDYWLKWDMDRQVQHATLIRSFEAGDFSACVRCKNRRFPLAHGTDAGNEGPPKAAGALRGRLCGGWREHHLRTNLHDTRWPRARYALSAASFFGRGGGRAGREDRPHYCQHTFWKAFHRDAGNASQAAETEDRCLQCAIGRHPRQHGIGGADRDRGSRTRPAGPVVRFGSRTKRPGARHRLGAYRHLWRKSG